ncbi:MAG: hypothetical protein LBE47_01530 [Methanomassiliicoccaceae archaeon]|nr:hypothetical protein [Methanomassiliicoccaceae archaeon]
MSRMKKFREIERALEQRVDKVVDNVVLLEDDDFRDGRLTLSAYDKIKHQCEFVGYGEDIDIIIPRDKEAGFRGSLENMVSTELSHIRKKGRVTKIKALVCMLAGILWFAVGALFQGSTMMTDITIIAAWVFIWTAVGLWFFDLTALRDKRFSLLHILTANVTVQDSG